MSGFLAELRRRNVIRVAGLYLAGAWLLAQVAGTVLPMFSAPEWLARSIVVVLAIGFVPAVVLTWVFEWTPKGLVRDSDVQPGRFITPAAGKRLDRWIVLVLVVAVGYFAFDKFVLSPQREAAQIANARQEGRSDAVVARYGDNSIAVLPFVDMSKDGQQEYLADGIAEELLNLLARIPELRVISRSSSFKFENTDASIPTIAEKLDVANVLEGSVRSDGDRVRISVQLIDGRSDTQLWSESYDRPLRDIFAIQDSIAQEVIEALKIELLGHAPTVRTTDPDAYVLYLQAIDVARRDTAEAYQQAIALLEQAVVMDPEYAPAWRALIDDYVAQATRGMRPADEGFKLAREAAAKALAADPDNAETYASLALISVYESDDLASAATYVQRALELQPTSYYNLSVAAIVASGLGRLQEAMAIREYNVTADPQDSNAFAMLCIASQRADVLDKSVDACKTALLLEPGRVATHYVRGVSLLLQGDARAAMAEMALEPFEPFRLFGEAMAYHSLGEDAKSDAALAETIAKYDTVAAYNIANIHAWRGNADAAFQWLDKAVEYGDSALPGIASDPLLTALHDDPRWLPLLRTLGKGPQQLAAIEFQVDVPDVSASIDQDK